MAYLTIEGVYTGGKVELGEQPVGIDRSRVMVTFLSDDDGRLNEQARRAAANRMIERMQKGLDFGGGKFNREELYAERIDDIVG